MRSILEKMGNLIARNAEGAAGGGAAPAAPAPAAGDAGAPAGAPAGAAATKLVEPAAAAPPPAEPKPADGDSPWYSKLPQDFQDVISAKGWKSLSKDEALEAVTGTYVNLERLFGADKAGNTVQLPKTDATPEEKRMFWGKLGASDKPEDYAVKAPDGIDVNVPAYQKAPEWFAELGVPKDLATGLMEKVFAEEARMQAEWNQASMREEQALQGEWGDNFDRNVEIGRRATKALGLDENAVAGIERVLGTKRTFEVMHKIGMNLLEADSPAPSNSATSFRVTPAQAAEKIEALQKDSEFLARYLSPNVMVRQKAIEEMEALTRIVSGS